MSEIENPNHSTIGNDGVKCRVINWPVKRVTPEPQMFSAYNSTRERLLSAHIELADPRRESLQERLAALTPGSKSALWLAPFLGISPNHVPAPIDLVYLDRNNCVLAVVESFPISPAASLNLPAGTLLALPAQTIASSGTLAGDQLILCSPRKMKIRLDSLQSFLTGTPSVKDLSYLPFSISHDLRLAPGNRVHMTSWEEIRQLTMHPGPNLPLCWPRSNRQESRRSPREFLPWVAAYFINKEAQTPASVRNISIGGMFVSTSERWFLGNIVQVTLTDWRVPSSERSIIINAMAVRWSNDGVGLRFVFQKPRTVPSAEISDAPLVNVTEKDLKHFLKDFKAGKKASR